MSRIIALLLVAIFLTASCIMVAKPALSSADAAEDSWTTKAPMQQARGGLCVAAVNGKIYAIGGSTASGLYPPNLEGGFVGTNEEYDPATDTWTFKKPMPTSRSDFAIAVYQNKIYCIGGIIGTEKVDVVYSRFVPTGANEVYDPATDTWEHKAPMPKARMELQANVVNGKIYLIDGSLNQVYDPATDSWASKAPMPEVSHSYSVWNPISAVVDSTVYVLSEFTNQLLIYDTKTDVWSQGATVSLSEGLSDGTAGATTGVMAPKRVYFIGIISGNPSSINYAYDPKDNRWTTGTALSTARLDFGVAVVNDKLYAIGGYTIDDPVYSGHVTASTLNEQYTPTGYGTPDSSYVPQTDSTPPEIKVISPINESLYMTDVSLSFTVNEAASWMRYKLDGNTVVEVEGNSTIAGLPEGSHDVTIFVTDTAGNTGASETIYFFVDDTAPVVSVLEPANKTYDVAEIQLRFVVNEQVSWMEYSLDSQPNVQITGNTTLTGLSNGVHNLTVYAQDVAGNMGVSEPVYFSVEIPFPTTPVALASAATVAAVGAGLLVYFKKRKASGSVSLSDNKTKPSLRFT
jgi:N-acetylneuraminic acid mutarotase